MTKAERKRITSPKPPWIIRPLYKVSNNTKKAMKGGGGGYKVGHRFNLPKLNEKATLLFGM